MTDRVRDVTQDPDWPSQEMIQRGVEAYERENGSTLRAGHGRGIGAAMMAAIKHASSNRVRWILMELGHADMLGRYADLEEAKKELAEIERYNIRGEIEYGIVEVDDTGKPIGEVIRHRLGTSHAIPGSATGANPLTHAIPNRVPCDRCGGQGCVDCGQPRDETGHATRNRVVEIVEEIAARKAASGSKAQAAGRWNVADARFEEARVLLEEVIPAIREVAT